MIFMPSFYFEVTLFQKLRMNITACKAAHAQLILKPFVISQRYSAFTLIAMKIR